jgi:glutathione peroxidase
MKNITSLLLMLFPFLSCSSQTIGTNVDYTDKSPIYQFSVKDINGKDFSFETLRGKKILIVNTASKCGFTPQYKDLQALYDSYKDKNLVIIGFPENDFLNQEPGNDSTIIEFCQLNYGVTFPMMSKISVKGKDIAPIYKYLTTKSLNGYSDAQISWNFQKYLINEQGYIIGVFTPKTSPLSKEITDLIK